jgi:acyl CoA:acetate/3-ketoacid CoA transferase beta subunit
MTRGGHLDLRSRSHLLTGIGCAGRIYTDLAVFDVMLTGLKLVDFCDGLG